MPASMCAQQKQLTLSISKSKLSTHCICIAKMVAYRAQILNFLPLYPVISILNDVHNEILYMGGVQINRAFDQINKKMLQSRLIAVPVRIAQRILLKVALKMI